jgi:hypothetical protein
VGLPSDAAANMSPSGKADVRSVLKHLRPDDAWKCQYIDSSLILAEKETLYHLHNAG